MPYTFELLGVSPILEFFNHQQEQHQQRSQAGVEYVGTYKCTLDAMLQSVETIPTRQNWQMDQVVDTVIQFWMSNSETIQHWRDRLQDAGRENLLVARLSDVKSLRHIFETLL